MGGHFQQGVERYWNLGGKMKKKYKGRVPKNGNFQWNFP